MDAPEFLDLDDVLRIHHLSLEQFGGLDGVRDQGLLESAIAQPPASFGGQLLHEDLFAMAAAYAFHIAENQPFVDGNKRTGLGCALVFLGLNGHPIEQPTDRLYQAMIAVASGELNKVGLADLFRELAG